MQDILSTLATVTEIAIAAVIVIGAFNPRPRKIEVSVTINPEIPATPIVEPAAPEAPVTAPAPKVSRIAELRAKFGTTLTTPASIAPHLSAADVEAALTAATVTPEVLAVPAIPATPAPIALPTTSTALRKLCSEYGIRWGHVNGRNRHATPEQMIAALSAVVAA